MHSEGGSAPGDQGDIGAVVRRQTRRSVRRCILHIIEQKSVRKMHKGVEFCILVSKQGCIYVSNDWLALLLLYSYSRQECTLERFPAVAKILLSLPTSSPSFFFINFLQVSHRRYRYIIGKLYITDVKMMKDSKK